MTEPTFIQVNEFDIETDSKFIENILVHYLSEVFNDLLNREPVESKSGKLSFKVFSEVRRNFTPVLLLTRNNCRLVL
jgi:hypothetical protein